MIPWAGSSSSGLGRASYRPSVIVYGTMRSGTGDNRRHSSVVVDENRLRQNRLRGVIITRTRGYNPLGILEEGQHFALVGLLPRLPPRAQYNTETISLDPLVVALQ